MHVHKLTRHELTRWRDNTRHLVDDDGFVTTRVTPALEGAISTVMRSAQSQRKTLTQRVAIGSGSNVTEHTIVVSVSRTGTDMGHLAITATVDGQRLVTGREVLCAELLQKYGECQLRAPNNVILKVVRNPDLRRPTFKESEKLAPSPEHCPCKAWGNPHPGTHYPTCQWNRLAPPEERAPSDAVPEDEARMLPTEALASLKPRAPVTPATAPIAARVSPTAVTPASAPLDPPGSCRNGCLSWATPQGFPIPEGQHHPTCAFAHDWAVQTARDTPRFLVDLHTGEVMRRATLAEVGEAEVVASRTGNPIVTIEGQLYAVVLESEIQEAKDANVTPATVAASSAAAS